MPQAAPQFLSLPTGPAQITWRRSARARRISLRIDPRQGTVVVTLPMRAATAAGMALLKTHAGWVADRLAALPAQTLLADGAEIPLHGNPIRIRHVPKTRGVAWVADDQLHVTGQPEHLARRVRDFLRAEALRRLSALVAAKTAVAGLKARRVAIKDTRSRWGSCTPDGVLMFSWRLVMAPPWVQDYVVAHEVAHLRHMNHGPRFWALVEQLSVYTDQAVIWLRNEGPGLLRIG
jgi:predicted metal-dependent hydrolase